MIAAARIPASIPIAALITFGAFFLMHLLIATGRSAFTDEPEGRVVDFVRVQKEEQIQKKDRKPERPPAPESRLKRRSPSSRRRPTRWIRR